MKRRLVYCVIVAFVLIAADQIRRQFGEKWIVVEHTDYHKPNVDPDDPLVDEVFDAVRAPQFDPARIDSRPADGWSVNLTASVTKLDLDLLLPDVDGDLLRLNASYLAALRAARPQSTILPSVNLIDGKAKQFDDGLYAALEEHWFRTREGDVRGDLDFFQRLAAAVPENSRAAAYFAVGLEMAGISVPASNQSEKSAWKAQFNSREMNTKPLGFYAWTTKLQQCYRVSRFFQLESPLDDMQWLNDIIDALRKDAGLLADYRRILARWSRLSNLPWQLTVLDLVDHPDPADLQRVRSQRRPRPNSVSLIPPGTNRESELTRRLFPTGFSSADDLMREIVLAVRRGEVDLRPTQSSGWYDYEVYALETLLVPKRGEESVHLLLSGAYKRRMQEAFQALMTKRKETHILRGETGVKSAAAFLKPLNEFSPRLRLEPAPTYYLRMARSYRFLDQVLRDLIGEAQLAEIRGLTREGTRNQSLLMELESMRRLFYGCYALSAEDIGLGLNLTPDEAAELDASRNLAETWLGDLTGDPDLGADTRVIVPVAEDKARKVMSTWATLGVRFARLKVSYQPDAAPRVRSASNQNWVSLTPEQLGDATYLIPVDEFASIQIPNSRVLSREEFRKVCDESMNSKQIIRDVLGRQ